MDQKGWLWRKIPSEKTISATDKLLMVSKEGVPDNAVKNLNEKLASVLINPHSSGGDVINNVKIVDTANAVQGQENVETEVRLLKKELEESLRREMVVKEMLSCTDAALREHMQQLDLVRSEQDQRICDVVMKTWNEFERVQIDLEERLKEANRRLAQLTVENSQLSSAMLVKEKMMEAQRKHKSQMEAEFSTLMGRLDSLEKENAFLKYECRILEEEVEIRNEEMEYNRRSADAAHKQNLVTAKEMAKLEAECQRLHLLLRKRLTGPSGVVKMKSEFGMLGGEPADMRRRSRRINAAREQSHNVEEQNRNLREIMTMKDAELRQSWQLMHSLASSRTSSDRSQTGAIEVPEMRLMDDFAEMEKLAIVSTDSEGLVPVVHDQWDLGDAKHINSKAVESAESFDWLQAVLHAIMKQKCISKRSPNDLLEDIRIALDCGACVGSETSNMPHSLESSPNHVSGYITWKDASPGINSLNGASSIKFLSDKTNEEPLQSDLTKAISKIIQLIEGIDMKSSISDNTSGCFSETDQSPKQLTASGDHSVHVFQWRTSELSTILHRFVCACKNQLNGKSDLGEFVEEVSFVLEYILNSCLNPKQASNTRDKIKRHVGWNNLQSKKEIGVARHDLSVKSEVAHISEQKSSHLPTDDSDISSYNKNVNSQGNGVQHILREENQRLQDELKNMNTRLESAADKSKALTTQLQESEATIGGLKNELKKIQEEKEMMEDQIDDQKSINEDLYTQLTVVKAKLNDIFQKCSSLEVELEYKNNCCEDLEATCLELQLQVESIARKDLPKESIDHERRLTQNGWEITAASVKLAECQETILNLGKQLEVLASSREAALFNKLFPNGCPQIAMTNNKILNKHLSLRDQMLADDAAKAEGPHSPDSITTSSNRDVHKPSIPNSRNCMDLEAQSSLLRPREMHLGSKRGGKNAAMALAIVPSKKPGISLLKRLLLRRKRGSGMKAGC